MPRYLLQEGDFRRESSIASADKKKERKKEKRGKELYPLWRRREIVGALRPLPVPPHPVPPPPLPAFLAHTGPFPPSPSLFVFAYFAALCHTVHPRAHLSRDLANHRASIEPALSTTHLCRPCEIIGEKNKTASQLSQSTGRGCRLMVVVSPFFFFPLLFPLLDSSPPLRTDDPRVSVDRSIRQACLLDQTHRAAIRGSIGEVHTARWHGIYGYIRGKFSSWPRRRRMPGYCSRSSFWASLFSSDDSATVASGGIDRRRRRRRRRRQPTLKADTRGVPCLYASSHILYAFLLLVFTTLRFHCHPPLFPLFLLSPFCFLPLLSYSLPSSVSPVTGVTTRTREVSWDEISFR